MAPGRHPPAVQPQDSTVARSESPRPPNRGALRPAPTGSPLDRAGLHSRTARRQSRWIGRSALPTPHRSSASASASPMSVRLDLTANRLTPGAVDRRAARRRATSCARAADGARRHRGGRHRRRDACAAAGTRRRARRSRQQRRRCASSARAACASAVSMSTSSPPAIRRACPPTRPPRGWRCSRPARACWPHRRTPRRQAIR